MDAVSSPQNLSVGTVITPELLDAPWAKLALREPSAATRVVNFKRITPAAALGLTVKATRPAAQVDLRWRVGPRHADLAATVNVSSAADDLVLVELELPPRFKLVQLGEVAGAHVHHWSRQDRRVQVWLQQPRKQIKLEVRGWVEHVKPGPGARFDLAPLRVLNVRSLASAVALVPEPGLALHADRVLHLTPAGKGNALQFTSSAGNYEASFTMTAAPIAATARAFTLVERRDEVVEITTALHLRPQPGEVRVTVSGWTGNDLQLDTPAPVVTKAYQRQGAKHDWTLQMPPGLPETVTLVLRGRMPAPVPGKEWALAAVHVDPGALQDHWIGLVGVEPVDKVAAAMHVAAAAGPTLPEYPAPPRALRPGAQVGKLKAPGDALRLRNPPAASATSTQILLAEHAVAWGGTSWVHELRVLVFANDRGELRVRLPEDARCRAVAVDSRVVVPNQGELLIPLPGPPGPRVVQVCWSFPVGESRTEPRLDRPLVAGLAPADIRTRFWLPPAYHLARFPGGLAEAAVDSLLDQAEARMRLCELLPDADLGQGIASEQQALYGDLAQADASVIAALQRTGEPCNTAGLTQRAKRLREDNARLAKEKKYPAQRPTLLAAAQPHRAASLGSREKTGSRSVCKRTARFGWSRRSSRRQPSCAPASSWYYWPRFCCCCSRTCATFWRYCGRCGPKRCWRSRPSAFGTAVSARSLSSCSCSPPPCARSGSCCSCTVFCRAGLQARPIQPTVTRQRSQRRRLLNRSRRSRLSRKR